MQYPRFPSVHVAPSPSEFPSFSIFPDTPISTLHIEESGELVSSVGSSITSDEFIAVSSPYGQKSFLSENEDGEEFDNNERKFLNINEANKMVATNKMVDLHERERLSDASVLKHAREPVSLEITGREGLAESLEDFSKPFGGLRTFQPVELKALVQPPLSSAREASVQTQMIDGVHQSVQTAPIATPILTKGMSSKVTILGARVLNQSTQSNDQHIYEREWDQGEQNELVEWTHSQQQDCKETIEKVKSCSRPAVSNSLISLYSIFYLNHFLFVFILVALRNQFKIIAI